MSIIKEYFWIGILFLLSTAVCRGQHTLRIAGGNLKVVGNTSLVLRDAQLVNNGAFTAGTGTVSMTGTATDAQAAINGSSSTTFYNLQVNKSSNGSQLQRAVQVDNMLLMTAGNLDLNGNNLTLGDANGIIAGESEPSRVTGASGGFISKTIPFSAPAGVNPGNIGVVLTSGISAGSLTIRRGHIPQTLGANTGIARHFEFVHSNTTNLNLSGQFLYFDAELNGNTEANLGFWREDASIWSNPSFTSHNVNSNNVSVDGINLLTKWTLGPGSPQNLVDKPTASPTENNAVSSDEEESFRVSDPWAVPTTNPLAEIRVFPNPTTGYLRVDFQQTLPADGHIQLLNLRGQAIRTLMLPAGEQQQALDLSNLPKGNYMLRIVCGEQLSTHQVVLQ